MKNFISELKQNMLHPVLNVGNLVIDQMTKEEFLAYLFPQIGGSKEANDSIKEFDSEFRGKAMASHRDFYPAMPSYPPPVGVIKNSFVRIPVTKSAKGLQLFVKCRKIAMNTPNVRAGYPLWHLHVGFEYIIQYADEIIDKEIRHVMFYFFDANLHIRYVWIEIISANNMIIRDVFSVGIIGADWEKIIKQGKMHLLLNYDKALNTAFD